jgi:hypothetical protein
MRVGAFLVDGFALEGGDSTFSLWAEEERLDELGFVPGQHSDVDVVCGLNGTIWKLFPHVHPDHSKYSAHEVAVSQTRTETRRAVGWRG